MIMSYFRVSGAIAAVKIMSEVLSRDLGYCNYIILELLLIVYDDIYMIEHLEADQPDS